MHNNKPGRGFIGTLNWLVRRLRCPHARTFTMYPENVHWHRNGEHRPNMGDRLCRVSRTGGVRPCDV
jgi:hypothetical protein